MAFSETKALALLKHAFQEKRLGHAYLITGSSDATRQKLAEELAAIVLSSSLLEVKRHPDVHMVGPESKSRKIVTEQMRGLEEALSLKSQQDGYRVAIIHDAERMVLSAANAFLKTLEEPPDQTLLLLTTSLPEALLETIRSRCLRLSIESGEEPEQGEYQQKVTASMESFFSEGREYDVAAAFQLARRFQELLATIRAGATKAAEEEFQLEKKHFGKTTEGSWEGPREQYFKATAEASVLAERSLLLDAIAAYFGKKLSAVAQELAQNREEALRLFRALDVVDRLQSSLEAGVQEGLALEASFLELVDLCGNASSD
jgi:DNA polymerase-3 subunit delta'